MNLKINIKKLHIPQLGRRRLLVLMMSAVAIYIAIATLGVIGRNYQLQQEIDRLRQENEVLALQNQELEHQITYYRTDAFVEKEARDKLGLKAPGEQVVIFPDKIPQGVELPKAEVKDESLRATVQTNLQQWLYFLFEVKPG